MKQRIRGRKGTLLVFFGVFVLSLTFVGCRRDSLQTDKTKEIPKIETEMEMVRKEDKQKKETEEKNIAEPKENTGTKKADHPKLVTEETEAKENVSEEFVQQKPEKREPQTENPEIKTVIEHTEKTQSEITGTPVKTEGPQVENVKIPAEQTKPAAEAEKTVKVPEQPKESELPQEVRVPENTETPSQTPGAAAGEDTKSEQKPEKIPDQLDMSEIGDIYVSPEEYDEKVSNSEVGIVQ